MQVVRKRSLVGIAHEFVQLDLVGKMRQMDAKCLTNLLHEKNVLDKAGAMLFRLVQIVNWGLTDKNLSISGTVGIRSFLAMYLVEGHPIWVFIRGCGLLENALKQATTPFVACIQEVSFCAAAV